MKGDLFAGTSTPRPPADLKERALRAAQAAAREPSAPRRSRWGFNRLDLAWAAALVVLVVINVVLSIPHRPSHAMSLGPRAVAEARQLERELGWKGSIVVAGRDAERDREEARQLMRELERL
jgi:hypothetical protein